MVHISVYSPCFTRITWALVLCSDHCIQTYNEQENGNISAYLLKCNLISLKIFGERRWPAVIYVLKCLLLSIIQYLFGETPHQPQSVEYARKRNVILLFKHYLFTIMPSTIYLPYDESLDRQLFILEMSFQIFFIHILFLIF